MTKPVLVSRLDRSSGWIETLEPVDGGELYYRSCAGGMCRYSSDLWQAELYLDHLLTHS
jgi:hypothetical protein